jgi:predicted TIM-barrel fold metal-dependent hydrolase
MKIIDAHHHFWDPTRHYYPWLCDEGHPPHRYGDHTSLKRPYLPADYRRDTSAFELAGSVYMEADWDPKDPIGEMRFIDSLRRDSGLPSVAIGQAWLHQEDAQATLEQLAAFDFVRGIRQKPRANASPHEGGPGGMADDAWRRGYALLARHGFHYELQTPYWHLHEAAAVARDFPGTRIVVNHTGMPSDRSDQGLAAWRKAMAQVAECPNVAVKISGIGLAGKRWSAQENRDVVLDTVSIFGIDRCMFASNFPVDGMCASFETIYKGFASIVSGFSAPQQEALFHDNARRIYRIGE